MSLPPLADRPPVSISQAQQLVGVSRRTIYNWLKAGKLRYVRTPGGAVRIYPESLCTENRSRGSAHSA